VHLDDAGGVARAPNAHLGLPYHVSHDPLLLLSSRPIL